MLGLGEILPNQGEGTWSLVYAVRKVKSWLGCIGSRALVRHHPLPYFLHSRVRSPSKMSCCALFHFA
jgi:hypothetical protein